MKKQVAEGKVIGFVTKIFKIVRSKQYAKSITWEKEEKGIKIVDKKLLVQKVLPRYFKNIKFTSFVRQLNTYGFKKTHSSIGDCIFRHQLFTPYDKDSLFEIRRRVSIKSSKGNLQGTLQESMQQITHTKKTKSVTWKLQETKYTYQLSQKIESADDKIDQYEVTKDQILAYELAFRKVIEVLQKVPMEQQYKKLRQLKINSSFRRFLMSKDFYHKVNLELDIQSKQEEEDVIKSFASIEEGMLCTKRSIDMNKLLESGIIQVRGTIHQPTFEEFMVVNSTQQCGTFTYP